MDKTLHKIESCSISKLLREDPKFVSDLLKRGIFWQIKDFGLLQQS